MPTIKTVYSEEYAIINIDIDKGRDFSKYYGFLDDALVAIDMTGYSIAAQIRLEESSDSTLIDDFTIDTTDIATGVIYLTLTEVETAALNASSGYYDIKVTDTSGITKSWVKGRVEIHGTVTA